MEGKSRLRRFATDTSGAVIIIAALMMPVLVGGMGLGAEAGYRYFNQRMLQHAADVAAHAGATRRFFGDAKPQIDAAVQLVATQSGFNGALVPVVNNPPLNGAFTTNASAVEVFLTETRPRLFSAIFSDDLVSITVRAVAARTAGSSGCILALSGSGTGVSITGSTSVNLTGCSVAVNSNSTQALNMQSANSVLSVECVSTVGGANTNSNFSMSGCGSVITGSQPVTDPYAGVAEPTGFSTAPCQARNVGSPNQPPVNLTPTQTLSNGVPFMRFCNGLNAQGTVNFAPGVYIIEGGSQTTMTANGTLNGTGVTFYFTNGGNLSLGSNSHLNLRAPTSGPYSGILFFGSRNPPIVSHTIQGTPTSTMTGAIYMPRSHINFSGNSSTNNGCTQVIGNTVQLTGNSNLQANCATSGTSPIAVGQGIALVE